MTTGGSATSGKRLPALFIGHGSPTNALQSNRYTRVWRALGEALPRPRAVLVVSAHWVTEGTHVTAMLRPKTIHDFYGFPQALFDFDYPAPGSPEVAQEVIDAAPTAPIERDDHTWGLDHGAWSVLAHLYPKADVPVVQLSINAAWSFEQHLALGARLAPLRDRGILLLASGNVVHNLRAVDWRNSEGGADWAQRFEAAAIQQMTTDPTGVARLQNHRDFARAAPTTEHFIPLLYAAGAALPGERVQTLIQGCTLGSLSMASFGVGAPLAG